MAFQSPTALNLVQTTHLVCACPVRRRHSPHQRPRRIRSSTRNVAPPVMAAASDRALWANNITKSHDGRKTQFRDISLTLPRGAKIAILGANGCGKSTLLNCLASLDTLDEGEVCLRKGSSIALVSQELPTSLDMSQTALSAVLHLAATHTNSSVVQAALAYARALADVEIAEQRANSGSAAVSQSLLQQLATATNRMDNEIGAWEVQSYLSTAMTRLDLPRHVPLSELSGGQKRRVGIAAALVSRPDVLLLDEVTNHLSIEGIQFLEETLQDPSLSVLCISHDRYFVDAVCTTAIWELDGQLYRYGPGYDAFLSEKAARVESERKEAADLAKAFRKELDWMRRQPKARSTKAKSRIEDFENMQKDLKARQERLRPSGVRNLASTTARLGNNVLSLENVTIRRGDKLVLKDFSYTFQRGERIGICGGNGVGKSSFLRALLGQVPLEAGEMIVGETVVFGHFDQDGIDLTVPLSDASVALLGTKGGDEIRVIDYVSELISLFGANNVDAGNKSSAPSRAARSGKRRNAAPEPGDEVEARLAKKIEQLSHSVAINSQASSAASKNPLARMSPTSMLDHFGFERTQQHSFVSNLSGGERRRLQLMALLLKNPNFLLLDEVSNDLDVNTLTMLEELLLSYSGVLVLCSHDRFMLDRLVDHLLVIEGEGEVSLIEGKFTDYLDAKREMEMESRRQTKAMPSGNTGASSGDISSPAGQNGKSNSRARRLSFKEKKEFERLEREIEECQALEEELSKKLESADANTAYGDLAEWSAQLAQAECDIDVKTDRWVELAEIAGE